MIGKGEGGKRRKGNAGKGAEEKKGKGEGGNRFK
jgi:hypothetical protein